MKIAVIGSGNVGGTLGKAWARAGHDVTFGTRAGTKEPATPGTRNAAVAQAIRGAEVIVLAVPWAAVREVAKEVSDWSGKVVIDCINPIDPGFRLAVGFDSSGAETIAGLVSGASVVKAFNTTGFNNMANPVYGGKAVSMLFATDDQAARKAAELLIRDVGFDPVYAGPLKQARYLEPLAMLWISMSQQQGREFALTVVRR